MKSSVSLKVLKFSYIWSCFKLFMGVACLLCWWEDGTHDTNIFYFLFFFMIPIPKNKKASVQMSEQFRTTEYKMLNIIIVLKGK